MELPDGVTGIDTMDTSVHIVLMTAPDVAVAESLATELVEARLAACGNVVPGLTSVYWWEDEVERADEVLVILKTTAARVRQLCDRAVELHPYDVPEVLALPVTEGHEPYRAWVRDETRDPATN